jgi:hypothetical protein
MACGNTHTLIIRRRLPQAVQSFSSVLSCLKTLNTLLSPVSHSQGALAKTGGALMLLLAYIRPNGETHATKNLVHI